MYKILMANNTHSSDPDSAFRILENMMALCFCIILNVYVQFYTYLLKFIDETRARAF